MTIDLNDKPIVRETDDILRIGGIVDAVTNQIINNSNPEGTVYSIYGCWGSGKSSLINLVKEKIQNSDVSNEIKISEFKCWWLKDEEKIRIEFLNHLMDQIKNSNQKEIEKLFRKIALFFAKQSAISSINFLGQFLGIFGNLGAKVINYISKHTRLIPQNLDAIDKHFNELFGILEESSSKRFLIIIDDIDRLLPTQSLTLFNLIKTVGRLPNYSYLIAYDRQIVENLISKKFPSEGPHFLEKIIQIGFEIPVPSKKLLKGILLKQITKFLTRLDYQNDPYFKEIFDQLILPNILTLRDLIKLVNSTQNNWNVIKDYADPTDFLAIETIKIFQPNLYYNLRSLKQQITDEALTNTDKKEIARLLTAPILAKFKDDKANREKIRMGLMRLFPRLATILVGESVSPYIIKNDGILHIRGVRSVINFDMYFNYQIPNTLHEFNLIDDLIKSCRDFQKVDGFFKFIIESIEKHGSPEKFRILLEELISKVEKIHPEGYKYFLKGIFQNYKSLLKSFNSLNSGELGPNFIIYVIYIFKNLFVNQISEEEWSQLIYDGLSESDLDCLIDFAIFAYNQYNSNEYYENEFFVLTQNHSETLNSLTVKKIEMAVTNEEIFQCENFSGIMYWWDRLAGNQQYKKVKQFCSKKISDKKFVLKCAQSFITEVQGFTMPLETDTIIHEQKTNISFYIARDQVGKLMDVDQLINNAKKFYFDKNCSIEDKAILEKLLSAEVVNTIG